MRVMEKTRMSYTELKRYVGRTMKSFYTEKGYIEGVLCYRPDGGLRVIIPGTEDLITHGHELEIAGIGRIIAINPDIEEE